MSKNAMLAWFENNEKIVAELAQNIWKHPEISWEEKYASELYQGIFKENGFEVKLLENVPTALIAEYGEGKPIIGILGEYDALPGLSQKVSTIKEEVIKDGPGHACGHNLLGAAGLGAALAVKEAMKREGIKGTLRYYGCPAEENGLGKLAMIKNEVFNDLDVCLTWHPFNLNTVLAASMSSVLTLRVEYKGTPSHAGGFPQLGRSALDAIELMNVGVNYLREHVIDAARIHYIIDNGGQAPNIVPQFASSVYKVRSPYITDALDIMDRIIKIAKGAALMTETELTLTIVRGLHNTLHNNVLGEIVETNLVELGSPNYTEEEFKFAEELRNTVSEKNQINYMKSMNTPEELLNITLHNGVLECCDKGKHITASSDAGEVSWIAPFAQFSTAAFPGGISPHTWQATAATGSSIADKTCIFAAKILAGSLYDLITDETGDIKRAKEEYMSKTECNPYKSIEKTVIYFDGR